MEAEVSTAKTTLLAKSASQLSEPLGAASVFTALQKARQIASTAKIVTCAIFSAPTLNEDEEMTQTYCQH